MHFDISPSDTLALSDRYNTTELNWFMKKLNVQYQKRKIISNMNYVNDHVMIHGTGTKKGNISYSKWIRQQKEKLEDLNIGDNVFNKLKHKRKKNTVFSKLRQIRSK